MGTWRNRSNFYCTILSNATITFDSSSPWRPLLASMPVVAQYSDCGLVSALQQDGPGAVRLQPDEEITPQPLLSTDLLDEITMKTSRWIATVFLTISVGIAPAVAQQPNPERNAYFGETHIHTSWSFDAYVFGNMKTGPEDAYKFAMGQPIQHPAGYEIKITRPLDFMAVTDHSEYAGTVRLANDPNSDISKLPIAEKLKVRSKEDVMKIYLWLLASGTENKPIAELTTPASGRQRLEGSCQYCGQVLSAWEIYHLRGLRVELYSE